MTSNKLSVEVTVDALRASELRYRRLFESAKDGILILDATTGMVVDVNPFLIELLGLSREAFLGKKVWELGCFKDLVANESNFRELQAKEYIRYEDLPLETADGRRIEVEFVSNVYLVNQHKVIQCNIRDITIRKAQEHELNRLDRLYAALSQINHTVVHIKSREELFRKVCLMLAELGHFKVVWIGRLDPETHQVIPVASAGASVGYLDEVKIYSDDRPEGHGPVGLCIRENKPRVINNFFKTPESLPWHAAAFAYGLRAASALPICFKGAVWGALAVYDNEEHAFQDKEVALLAEAAMDISFAMENMEKTEKLCASEVNYRRLFETAKDGILILDATTGMVVDVNPFLIELLGFSREAFLGKKVWELGCFKDLVANESHFRELQAKKYIRYEDLPLETADGRRIEVEFVSNVYLVNQHKVIQCNIRDITQRRRAAAVLQDETIRRRVLFEQSRDGIVIMDQDGKICEANRRFAEMLGYAPAEVLQLHIWDWDTQWTREQLLGMLQAVDTPGEFIETRHRRKNGSIYDVEISSNSAIVAGQKLIFCVCRDVSERKRAAEAQTRLVTAVEQAAETILITDLDAKILYVNPAFEKISGYTRAEAYGQNPRILKSGKHDATFYQMVWATLTAGEVWSGRIINKRKDGRLYEEEATISPVRDTAGHIVNYVAVKRDITHEVMLEAQNRQAAKMEAIGQLAGGIAHDFNNMLQIILGNVEIILRKLPPEHPIQADLHDIQTATQRSADLTRQLLAFSRRQAITAVVFDMNAAISNSLKMLRRLVGENIQLRFIQRPELDCVFMDVGQLDQILANLTVNARDAIAGTGAITIEVTHRVLQDTDCRDTIDFVPPGDYVVLTYHDDGGGMSRDVQTHLFEPFFTTKGSGKGTGLGLAVVYGIVKQNNGDITVQSAPGQGTTFSIYLPRASAAALITTEKTVEQTPNGTETVLLVEDEKVLLHMLRRTLVAQGYKVLAAATPDQALQICAQHPEQIRLLLTDVIMPNMSGKELAERIQKLRPGIRVLYMSGYSADILEKHGRLPRDLHVLQKPFTGAALAQQIRAIFDKAPPAPAET